MANSRCTYLVGDAKVSVLNSGDSVSTIAEVVRVPEEFRGAYGKKLDAKYLAPIWTIHIRLPNASILVDPNDYDLVCPPGSASVPENYKPAKVEDQLLELGVSAEEITHVVITHRHFDHYAGVTKKDLIMGYVPSYPRASCLLNKADWESSKKLEEDAAEYGVVLMDPEEDFRSLGVVRRANLLQLLDGDTELVQGLRIISAPGETPGHQIVRVAFGGKTLYCIGDLYHHSIEVEHPSWMAPWADPSTNAESRLALATAASSEEAIVVAGHMPVGRIEKSGSTFRWVDA